VTLLAEVLLGDLELDGLAGVLEGCEERAGGFSDLEIDRAVLIWMMTFDSNLPSRARKLS